MRNIYDTNPRAFIERILPVAAAAFDQAPRYPRFAGHHINRSPHPTVVHVLYHDLRLCDGSVIAPDIVLTTASCVFGFWNKKLSVVVTTKSEEYLLYYVTNVDYHPDLCLSQGRDDLAILKLDEPINKNEFPLAKLPTSKARIPLGSHVVTYRWTEFGNQDDIRLQDTREEVVRIRECTDYFTDMEERLFCTVSRVPDDVTHQMTGGPSMFNGYQVGIVTAERVSPHEYVFFTNVTHYLDWIHGTIAHFSSFSGNTTAFYPLSATDLKFYSNVRKPPAPNERDLVFAVAITNQAGHMVCVGTIISTDMVLTTARCAKKGLKTLKVRVVSINYVEGFKQYDVTKVYVHPQFDEMQFPHVHDLAILVVKSKFEFGVVAGKIEKIGWRGQRDPGSPALLYGYGRKFAPRLMYLAVMDSDECNWVHEKIGGLTEVAPVGSDQVSRYRRFVGHHINVSAHPTVVHVLYEDLRVCDGSIIAPDIILTTASCVLGFWNKKLSVAVPKGGENFSHHYVTNVDYHPEFSSSERCNELAILKLAEPIDKNEFFLAKLPTSKARIPADSHVITYRWTEFGNHDVIHLQDTREKVTNIWECTDYFTKMEKRLFCTESRVPDDVTHQMTGGPSMFNGYQVGIVISERVYPHEFVFLVNVTNYLDWINETSSRLSSFNRDTTAFYPPSATDLKFYSDARDISVSDKQDFVFTVAITNKTTGRMVCVASIISTDMVLTTARCAKKGFKDVKVRVVSVNYVEGFREYDVTKIYLHPQFDETQFPHVHDLAILTIKPKLNLGVVADKIEKIGWSNQVDVTKPALVYGYRQKFTPRLVATTVLDKDECDWMYEKIGGLTEGLICVRSRHGMCGHAAGEPVIFDDQMIGIMTAISNECADVRHPAVLINVTDNLEWIKKRLSFLNVKEEYL
ncbi:hypothetical protein QAD02_023576 [Eretmocerus hayati]|uniref:Uncharacterized protein n=1 Tax=Eretmocerus hayati TaxID=131215 RepID=A0ACC2PWM0_9HYME|nr:hypothetical protein QAD02_023576 [Eretmocerus hayati]